MGEPRTVAPDHQDSGDRPRGQDPTPWKTIIVTQKNADALTRGHEVTNAVVGLPVTATPAASFRFSQSDATAEIREYLFEVRKAGKVFWVGAAVPNHTTDFTRAHVFFHPTVVQGGEIRADDKDYPEFKGKWPTDVDGGGIQRYVPMQGGQLAAAERLVPLLVPFTTMAALKTPAENMFSDRPIETLNAVMAAIESEITGNKNSKPTLAAVGAASFSSGIMALRLFLSAMRSSGIVKEVIDFDSPHIVTEPKMLTRCPGAVSKCFTRKPGAHPEFGYVVLRPEHFETVVEHLDFPEPTRLHARIGWMMYHQAMMNSVI